MRETVIVEAVRTPVGKRNGGLSTMHAADLSAIVLGELLQCPVSTPRSSTTWCGAAYRRSGTNQATSVATRYWPQAGRRASRARRSTARGNRRHPVTQDEGARRGSTVEKLAALKPAFLDDGVIHAGNSSQISDGAAALLVTTSAMAVELGLNPLVRYRAGAVTGADPVLMLTGPIPATEKVLAKAGVSIADVGVFEVNAPVPGVARRNRSRPGPAQPAGRCDRARPPTGRLRRSIDDPDGTSHARQRNSLRIANHV